jgi:hypothetical protein
MANIHNIIITPLSVYDFLDPSTDILSNLEMKRIREFPNKQNWNYICLYKNLSKEFIIEFAKYIFFDYVVENKLISDDIKNYCKMFI